MKQFNLIIALLFSFAGAREQGAKTIPQTNEQKAHTQALKMQKILTLSEDQTVKVEVVLLKRIEKIAAISNETETSGDVKQNEIQEAKDASEKELAAIFTPEQYTIFLRKKEEAKTSQENSH